MGAPAVGVPSVPAPHSGHCPHINPLYVTRNEFNAFGSLIKQNKQQIQNQQNQMDKNIQQIQNKRNQMEQILQQIQNQQNQMGQNIVGIIANLGNINNNISKINQILGIH